MKYNIEVVLIASEVIPFSKTGGLADVAGSLPKALAQIGVKVLVFSPFYLSAKSQFKTQRPKKRADLIIKVGERMKTGQVYHNQQASVDFYFIANKEYFEREFLYGSEKGDYPDNGQRFIFFSKAVLESMTELNIKPDIIHCHDWQTALVPLYLKTIYSHNFSQAKTVFTIHNLGYQGMFSQDTFYDIGVAQRFFTPDTLEFYGKVNFLKAGLLYADLLTTVSPTYAKEIQTKEFGFGLDSFLSMRSNDLSGIINGIDYSIWDPAKDKFITPNYNIETVALKEKIKAQLAQELNLNLSADEPLIGFVGRLARQKGIEIIIAAANQIIENAGLVILGTGEEKYHKSLIELQSQFPKRISANLSFNDRLAHRIYAGSDIFLMPSHYEPCGLGQMIAFKYGSLPVGFKTGGLADTIIDYSLDSEKGNGFLFNNYNADDFLTKLNQAINLYKQKEPWQNLKKRAMGLDFSWHNSAQQYLELYSKLIK